MATITIQDIKVTDDDVVLDEFVPEEEYDRYGTHPYLLHDYGFCIAVVFASNLQDALDIAVDNDKMDRYLIPNEDYDDYGISGEEPTCDFLGNYSTPHDIESLGVIELENPPMSFCALYEAAQ